MIGKLLSRDADTQHLEFQWLWNKQGNMLQPMHLGWNKAGGGFTWQQPKGRKKPVRKLSRTFTMKGQRSAPTTK